MNDKIMLAALTAVALGLGFAIAVADEEAADKTAELEITAESFRCLTEMTPVKHFYVDNLLGDVDATVAIAKSEDGGVYPPGSVVQLVPTEVMVKRQNGFNDLTKDWEFFELDVSSEGSSIRNRGFTDVVNKFGGNCFGCHIQARPEWDMICGKDHGCAPIPVTTEQIVALQQADPRCAADGG